MTVTQCQLIKTCTLQCNMTYTIHVHCVRTTAQSGLHARLRLVNYGHKYLFIFLSQFFRFIDVQQHAVIIDQ